MSDMGAACAAQIATASLWIMTESLHDHVKKQGTLNEMEEDMISEVMRMLDEGRKDLAWILETFDEEETTWRDWAHIMMRTVWRTADVTSDVLLEILELYVQAKVDKPPKHLTMSYMAARQAYDSIIGYCETGEVQEDTPSDDEIHAWMNKEDEGHDG